MDLEWTGERYVPQIRGIIALEHLHRYAFASEHVKDKVVLDIACGEGYGSEILSRYAENVYGFDIDSKTIKHASKKYVKQNLHFQVASCTKIPLPDSSVDVVVSFETIEHVDEQELMLFEMKRIMRPGGILIISSPDKHEYSEIMCRMNPFHVKELTISEFSKVLSSFFNNIALFGQRVIYGSALTGLDEFTPWLKTYEFSKLPCEVVQAQSLPKPAYVLAICSDNPIPRSFGSMCEQNITEAEQYVDLEKILLQTQEEAAERTKWAQNLDEELVKTREAVARAQGEAAERTKWAQNLDEELVKTGEAVARAQGEAAERTEWAQKLNEDLQKLRETMDRVCDEGDEMEEWAQKLNEELEKSREAVARAQGEALERTEWAQKLNEELEKSREAVARAQGEAAELSKKLDVFRADNITLSEVLSAARLEISDEKRHISDLRAKLMEKEDQFKKVESDFYAYQNKLASLETRLRKLHDETLFITSPIEWFKKRSKFISRLNFIFQGLRNLLSIRHFFIFDPHWYLAQNADVKKSGKNPYIHYAFFGISENRMPNRRFRIEAYDPLNPDVKRTGMPTVLHYLLHGYREKRISNWLERYINIHYGAEACSRVAKLLDLLLYGHGVDLSKKEHSKKLKALISCLQAIFDTNPSAPIASPTVSVIIPVYNQVFHTLACLISLFESAPKACFEVIIADDCSTDETATILAKFSDRIRIVRTPGNLGFLKNCNHAAKAAKGEFVVFLNNDMVLLPEWLDSLVATISKDRECGMVGSKLLNLDGTLQEAGGIFWNDGSAWNYGRGQNPMAPEFNYKKEVDYCSGASICLRKEVWDAVGGFDEIYAPAYCEESDLAFRLRARGLKTIYQPRSVGIHLEGVSCGTDTAQGIKAYQVENQKKLLARWSGVLKKEHFENGTNVFHARGRTKSKKSILIVDHYIPQHDRDAGSRTMLHIIERFLENGYNVIFWPENLHRDTKYAQHLQEMGVLVLYGHEFVTDFEAWFKANAKFLHGVFLSRPQVADNVINTIRIHSKLKVAFYGHDVHHLRLQRKVDMDPSDSTAIGEAKLLKEVEQKIWGEVDVIYYPSQDEVDYVAKNSATPVSTKKIRVLPPWAFHDFLSDVSANLAERAGLLFVAGFAHTPNIEGALWFTKNVWPLVLTKYPSAKLTLAGSNPVPEITALRSDSVKVTGYIPDNELEILYRSSRVSIAPLLHGAGVKGKVVEALKFGLPVVTTPTGAQGIPDSSHAIDVAESPEEMAKAILNLLTEDKLWLKQSAASLQLIKNLYSTDAMWEPMKDLF